MPRTLDYSATWNDATEALQTHKEGLTAIAGLLIFIPLWIQGMTLNILREDIAGLGSGPAVWNTIGEHLTTYWFIYLPIVIASIIGSASIYALLIRKDLPRIGDTIKAGLAVAPLMFLASLIANLATFGAMLALIIPGLYVWARLLPTGPTIVAQPSLGPIGAISRAWELTRHNGWAVFGLVFVIALVAVIILVVIQLISSLIIALAAGPEGIPLLQTGIEALCNSLVTVLMLTVRVAIYQRLALQDA